MNWRDTSAVPSRAGVRESRCGYPVAPGHARNRPLYPPISELDSSELGTVSFNPKRSLAPDRLGTGMPVSFTASDAV